MFSGDRTHFQHEKNPLLPLADYRVEPAPKLVDCNARYYIHTFQSIVTEISREKSYQNYQSFPAAKNSPK